MTDHILMHKDVPVLTCRFDDDYLIAVRRVHSVEHCPLSCADSEGRVTLRSFGSWLDRRVVPANRIKNSDIVPVTGESAYGLMLRSFGCNLSDRYWLKPAGLDVSWKDVNFYDNDFEPDLGHLTLRNIPAKSSYYAGPDSSSGGEEQKGWFVKDGKRLLYKNGEFSPYAEVIGSELCADLGCEHVQYQLDRIDGKNYSACECMLGDNEEIVPAYDIMLSLGAGRSSDLDRYKAELRRRGIRNVDRRFDDMIVTDFLLENTDRHWNNFGIIRDADTLKWIRCMPLFDFGKGLRGVSPQPIGKLTGEPLRNELRHVTSWDTVDIKAISLYPDLVDRVLRSSDLPRSRAVIAVDLAAKRAETLIDYIECDMHRQEALNVELCE